MIGRSLYAWEGLFQSPCHPKNWYPVYPVISLPPLSQFRQHILFRFRHIFHKVDFGPGESTDLLMSDFDVTKKTHKRILVFHLPGLMIYMGPERCNHIRRIGLPDGFVHEQRVLVGGLHQAAQDLLMEEHVRIHDDRVVIQCRARDPERGNAAAMKLLVHEEIQAHATRARCHSRANHLLLVSHNHVGAVNPDAPKRPKVAMQEGLPADLDEALRAMLRDLPQALPDPGRKDDGFHAVPQTRSNASRNPTNWASVRAPMLATRKILLSSWPWPA